MIELKGVSARAGGFELRDVSFELGRGSYGVIIGPAGSGKTTLLETIAGIIPVTSGRIFIAGEEHTHSPPELRRLGIVYQHAYLFPHLSVRENVRYGAQTANIAEDMAERFGATALFDRPVTSLSGGERQLVALARALARQPDVLLLDEPFSALDPRTRAVTRRTLRAIYHERRFTALQVTHDFSEAGLLGDIAIMLDRGRIAQQGPPEQVFREPSSPYIADFLGAENVFAGVATAAGDAIEFATGSLKLYALGDVDSGAAHAVIRAEEISLSVEPLASSMQNHFRGRIIEIAPAGGLSRVTVDVVGTPIVAAVTARSVRELHLAPGVEIVASFKATAVHLC